METIRKILSLAKGGKLSFSFGKSSMFVHHSLGWIPVFLLMFANSSFALSGTKSGRYSCPADLEGLTPLLLRDLPAYGNRMLQRSRRRTIANQPPSYILLAGNPDTQPLSLGPGPYTSTTPGQTPLQQLFITTLEREYVSGSPVKVQQFHWLFLTRSDETWYLAIAYTRVGGYPLQGPTTPTKESTNGLIGQAVQNWLRDCRAGRIRPLTPSPSPILSPKLHQRVASPTDTDRVLPILAVERRSP